MENANSKMRNLRTLLYALDAAGEATAALLAEQTGLSVATISRGLNLLKSEKLVVQRRKDTAEIGRRPDVFSINGAYAHCFYCRLYGNTMSGFLLDLGGKVVARETTPAAGDMSVEEFLDKLLKMQASLLEKKRSSGCILTVSLAIPGIVDVGSGAVTRIPNYPCFENIKLAKLVEEALGHPCFIYNGARLSAVGAYLESSENIENLVYMDVTGDSGIGAGIVLGGKLYKDRNGLAGEVGDMVIHTDTAQWLPAGNQGLLEREAGLSSVYREARNLLERGMAPELSRILQKSGSDRLTLEMLEKAASQLDLGIYELLNQTSKIWSAAIVNICAILSPDVVILGGAVHEGNKLIGKMVQHHLRQMYYRPISLQFAKKGAAAHILGAAHLSGRFLLDMALEDTQSR